MGHDFRVGGPSGDNFQTNPPEVKEKTGRLGAFKATVLNFASRVVPERLQQLGPLKKIFGEKTEKPADLANHQVKVQQPDPKTSQLFQQAHFEEGWGHVDFSRLSEGTDDIAHLRQQYEATPSSGSLPKTSSFESVETPDLSYVETPVDAKMQEAALAKFATADLSRMSSSEIASLRNEMTAVMGRVAKEEMTNYGTTRFDAHGGKLPGLSANDNKLMNACKELGRAQTDALAKDEAKLAAQVKGQVFVGEGGGKPDTSKLLGGSKIPVGTSYVRSGEQQGTFELVVKTKMGENGFTASKVPFQIAGDKIHSDNKLYDSLEDLAGAASGAKGSVLRPLSLSVDQAEAQFQSVPVYGDRKASDMEKPQSHDQTRYTNVLPYQQNRIHLGSTIDGSDYVNASPIQLTEDYSAIALQAPTEANQDRTWQMLFEQDVSTIVTVTNHKEVKNGQVTEKSIHYWQQGGWEGKGFKIEQKSREVVFEKQVEGEVKPQRVIKRTFMLTDTRSDPPKSKEVTQFQLNGWPDHGVADKEVVKKLSEHVHAHEKTASGKTAAHCSAGIGRTGVFMAAHSALKAKESGAPQKSALETMAHMRNQRMWMIQTADQLHLASTVMHDIAYG